MNVKPRIPSQHSQCFWLRMWWVEMRRLPCNLFNIYKMLNWQKQYGGGELLEILVPYFSLWGWKSKGKSKGKFTFILQPGDEDCRQYSRKLSKSSPVKMTVAWGIGSKLHYFKNSLVCIIWARIGLMIILLAMQHQRTLSPYLSGSTPFLLIAERIWSITWEWF